MPATPFPHPSVHTTTTVHSLSYSRIHSRAHSRYFLNQFHSSKTAERLFTNAAPRGCILKILVSYCGVDWKSRADLQLIPPQKKIFSNPMTSQMWKQCRRAAGSWSGPHTAKNWIYRMNVDCKVHENRPPVSVHIYGILFKTL